MCHLISNGNRKSGDEALCLALDGSALDQLLSVTITIYLASVAAELTSITLSQCVHLRSFILSSLSDIFVTGNVRI